MNTSTLRNAISIALFAVGSGATGVVAAQKTSFQATTSGTAVTDEAPHQFDLPENALAASLDAFAAQSGIYIAYQHELVADQQARAVQGHMDWRDALAQLLQGSGLDYRQADDGTVVIQQVDVAPELGEASAPADARASRAASSATELETITVTGTRIRGGTTPSPVITLGSERIREEGFSDLGEVIRSVPQNFSGGQNPEVGSGGLSGAGAANRNVTGGSGLNLRGLGPDATLTLLNGRRLSYGGLAQAVDISAIPVEAIDRIEIVPDGASAIYGSDAVGGVGNVILKRDFDGLTAGARYGAATSGGLGTREYVATAGGQWARGGWIGTFKRSSVDPISASQRSFTDHLVPPTTIYPGSTLRSGLLSGHQRLGERVEFRLDALRTERDQVHYYEYFGTNWIQSETTTSLVAPSLEVALAGDWTLTLGATWAKDAYQDHQTSVDAGTGVSEVVSDACYCNDSHSYEAGLEGSWFSVGGGDVRFALGAGYRSNGLKVANRVTGADTVEGESARFAYAEMAMPLFSPDQQVSNMHRLEFTAALRGEDYRTTGSVVTPKLGVVYGPSPDMTLKVSWGRAFKAPTLNERYSNSVAYLHVPAFFGGSGYDDTASVLYLGGGNPDLAPERARTWSTTLAFHPENMPGLEAEVGFFDIDYRDRVVEPIASITQAMRNPNYVQLIEYDPGAEEQARVLSGIDHVFNFTGAPYVPGNVVALINARRANVARQRIRGVDVSGSYRWAVADGALIVRGSGSWLDSTQQNLEGQGTYDLAGTLFNPASRRARVGLAWSEGGFDASSFVNYAAGVEDVANAQRTASFTTVDATVRYVFNGSGTVWSDVDIALSARNVLNRAPPLYTPALATYAPPYDGTNYSAVGRFLSLSISKRF